MQGRRRAAHQLRIAGWALVATASPNHHLLIRRLASRPDQYTFYPCHAPAGQPATARGHEFWTGTRTRTGTGTLPQVPRAAIS
jgi:hypothetical protein